MWVSHKAVKCKKGIMNCRHGAVYILFYYIFNILFNDWSKWLMYEFDSHKLQKKLKRWSLVCIMWFVVHLMIHDTCIFMVSPSLSYFCVISGFVKLWRPVECWCSGALWARQGVFRHLLCIPQFANLIVISIINIFVIWWNGQVVGIPI